MSTVGVTAVRVTGSSVTAECCGVAVVVGGGEAGRQYHIHQHQHRLSKPLLLRLLLSAIITATTTTTIMTTITATTITASITATSVNTTTTAATALLLPCTALLARSHCIHIHHTADCLRYTRLLGV